VKRIYAEQRGATGATEHNKMFVFVDDDVNQEVVFEWGAIGCKKPSKKVVKEADPARRAEIFEAKLKEKTKRKDNPYVIITTEDGGRTTTVESRPASTGRGWGLEVETHSNLSPEEIAAKMTERGLVVNVETGRYFHSEGRTWDVKRDGSCGYEFASPILRGEAGIFDAKLAVEKIREVCPNAVNRNCGIHVTIDMSDFSEEDLIRLVVAYLKSQEHFYGQCNSTRQDNRYCKRNPTVNLAQILKCTSAAKAIDLAGGWRNHDDRYHGLNFTRVFSRKVVEFRMLESSVDIRKVGAWIHTCVGFVDGVKKLGVKFSSTKTFSAETFEKLVSGLNPFES